MQRILLKSDSIISPLGFGTQVNLQKMRAQASALTLQPATSKYPYGYYAGIMTKELVDQEFSLIGNLEIFTRLEKMIILAISDVIKREGLTDLSHTGLVIATTKGNIDLLNSATFSEERLQLWSMCHEIAEFFGFKEKPVIVSNACISGGLAIKTAAEFIRTGKYTDAIVAAGDLVSEFVLSGFQSFQAMSSTACRPFDEDRNGISLGEAAAAVYLKSDDSSSQGIEFVDAVTTNDANHISGPSRDGEGLYQALRRLQEKTKFQTKEIDLLSAHGTATLYNDEMEAIAVDRMRLNHVPIHSLKAYFGHTLGASALIESIVLKHCLLNDELIISKNYENSGVSVPLNVTTKQIKTALTTALKTASGFGGCNIAMLLRNIQCHV